jgi:hypothetical protein
MFIVGKKTIETAPPCSKGRICLSGDMSVCCSCSVKQDEGDYLIIELPENSNLQTCPYSNKIIVENSDTYVCSCPVRKEIYRKYGK